MAEPFFSIITPSFNQGQYIRDCIHSVQTQAGGEDWEHIVIDGGSTDSTLAVLQQYPHLQWVSEPDRGQTDAIGKGFRRARGDWLMWLNADDYLTPQALAKVRAFVAAHPTADVVYGDCDYVTEQGAVVSRKREGAFEWNMLLFYGCYIPSTSTFLRRSIIVNGHLPDPAFKVCMDYEYYLRLAHASYRFEHLPATLACFRWHSSNVSSVHSQRRYRERLQLQRRYLALTGRSYLQREWTLKLLYRVFQARRFSRRLWRGQPRP